MRRPNVEWLNGHCLQLRGPVLRVCHTLVRKKYENRDPWLKSSLEIAFALAKKLLRTSSLELAKFQIVAPRTRATLGESSKDFNPFGTYPKAGQSTLGKLRTQNGRGQDRTQTATVRFQR